MTFTEIFEAIAEATGIEYSHFSVLGRIWDLADYYGVERRGKLVSQVLRELPQLVNRSPESNLISDLLNLTMRYSKYLSLTGAYSQETTTGAQLLDISNVTDRFDTTHELTDTGLTVTGQYYVTVANVDVPPNTDMYISYVKSGSGVNQVSVYKAGNIADSDRIYSGGGTGGTFNTGDNSQVDILFYSGYGSSSSSSSSTYNDVMLCEGTSAKPYEPYTGGAPSPNPDYAQEMQAVEISELKSSGRNMFDQSKFPTKSAGGATVTNNGDGSFTISGNGAMTGTLNNTYYDLSHKDTLKLLKAGSLVLDCGNASYPYVYMQVMVNNTVLVRGDNRSNPITSVSITEETLKKDGLYIRLGFYGYIGASIIPTTIKPMVYQDGDGTFEPYVSDTVTLSEPLILRALPNGVCDTYENGVITRRVGVVEFDGSVDEAWFYWEVNNSETCRFFITISKPLIYISENYSICDKLPYILGNVDEERYRWSVTGSTNNQIVIYIKKSRLTEIKVSALRLYLQSNPITVWYQLATPTTEALDIDLEWYGMENFWTDSELDPNMTWKGVSSGVD